MRMQTFEDTFKKDEFAVGDSFWLGDWEFQVVNTRSPGRVVSGDEVVFRWELTRREFVQSIADWHPDIEDPDHFFQKYRDEILHRFRKGLDILLGECGATYETVMEEAINEAVGAEIGLLPYRWDAGKAQGTENVAGDGGERGSSPSPSCSNTCKEVDEKMEFDMQSKVDEYLKLFERIKQKTSDEATAVSILQEISKDRRTAEIREEREAKNGEAKVREPATPKQKQFMKKLNIKFPADVTKQEASVLIDEERGRNGE